MIIPMGMPFARPTLAELIERIRGDMRGRLEIEGSLVRRAMADVVSTVFAGAVHTVYGFVDWGVRQLFGDTSDDDQLLRQASLYSISPTAATFASGTVIATGTNGISIPATTIIRLDADIAYTVTTGQVIASGIATLPVVAVLSGSASNLPNGSLVFFETPIAGVATDASVGGGGDIGGGFDQESIEEVRARYLLRLREPPQGGADQDYETWADEVAGVTRSWVYPHENGLGTVVVRFVDDDDPSSIFPNPTQVAAVQAALQAQRPITAAVTAVAPTSLAVAFTIHIVPDNADTRAATTAELTDLLRRVGEPGDGLGRGKVLLSQIRTAIGIAEGVTDYSSTVPSADVVPALGQLPSVGVITWV